MKKDTPRAQPFLMLLALLCLWPLPLQAQNIGLSTGSKEPLEITADGTLEWSRDEKTFVARQNALAKQGDSSIKADILTADYREQKAGGGMQIHRVTAEGEVVIQSNQSQASGDRAVYDLDQGLATMTGDDLQLTSPDQTVTAQDQFEYWVAEGRLNALGKAKVVRPKPEGGNDTLEADKISAVMKDNAKGARTLHSLEAIGNVVITSPTEKITGAYGIYRADSNRAEITGGVKIVRGPNILQGDRAEVDLNTNTSKIFGGAGASGRVKGVFYPDSEKKKAP
jgi:lipopolysaccharide export system protein LptA